MKYLHFFEIITSIIDCALKKYGIDKDCLEGHGTIFYMNGNDSTMFDFEMNGRLCEFGVFHQNGFYAVKVLVGTDQTSVYVYPDAEHPQDYRKDVLCTILEPDDLYELAHMIDEIEKGLEIGPETKDWDRPMSVLVSQLQNAEDGATKIEDMNDCAITGLIMTFGEDDISLNMLDLPESVANEVFALVEPYCSCSIRGSKESIAKEITG